VVAPAVSTSSVFQALTSQHSPGFQGRPTRSPGIRGVMVKSARATCARKADRVSRSMLRPADLRPDAEEEGRGGLGML